MAPFEDIERSAAPSFDDPGFLEHFGDKAVSGLRRIPTGKQICYGQAGRKSPWIAALDAVIKDWQGK